LGCVPRQFVAHGSILSRFGASGKGGAIQYPLEPVARSGHWFQFAQFQSMRSHSITQSKHSPARGLTGVALALAMALGNSAVAVAGDEQAGQVASFDQLPPQQEVSEIVIALAGWIVATRDSQGYPFAIIDKDAAQVLVFGGDGRLRDAAPGLFGSAKGDHIAPGIAGLALREIPGRDRTTPAGRFIGGFGPSLDAGRVLWVDYDSSVSIHPLATNVRSERRPERLASPEPDDNRVTHGCINVSPDFYELVIEPTFERGGVFYILPDTKPLAEVFPEFVQSRGTAQGEDGKRAKRRRQ